MVQRRGWVWLMILVLWPAMAHAEIGFQTGTLQGTVKTNAGEVPGATMVSAISTNGSTAFVSPDWTTGAYSMSLPVGDYTLVTRYEQIAVESTSIQIAVGTQTHDVTFAAGRITAQASRDGAPDPGAPVYLLETSPPPTCATAGIACDHNDGTFCSCRLDARRFRCDPMMGCQWEDRYLFQTQTDSTGGATRLVTAGTWSVAAFSSSPMPMPGIGQFGGVRVGLVDGLVVGDGAVVDAGVFAYETGTVTGSVTAGGQPLTNVTIRATVTGQPDLGTVHAWIDQSGTFTLRLPSSVTYTITAFQDGNSVVGVVGDVVVTAGGTQQLDFTLPGAMVSGLVTRDGSGVAGAQIYMSEQPPASCAIATSCDIPPDEMGFCHCAVDERAFMCGPGFCHWQMPRSFSASTDGTGRFEKFVPPGSYDLYAMSAQGPWMGMEGSVFGSVPIGTATVAVSTSPVDVGTFAYTTGQVSGAITSCGGPQPASLHLTRPGGGLLSAGTSSLGTYDIRVPSGPYSIAARAGNSLFGTQSITVAPETPASFSVAYDLGDLRGMIVRDGQPASFSMIHVAEAPPAVSCATATSCTFNDPMMGFCQCTEAGRDFMCHADQCQWHDPRFYFASTGIDGIFTVEDMVPGAYRVFAFSGSGMPMPGQGGGILVGTVDVTIAACQVNELGLSGASAEIGPGELQVSVGDVLELSFDAVSPGTVSFVATSTPPPGDPPPFKVAGLYYDIFVPAFDASVEVCFLYDADQVPAGQDLHLYHQESDGTWVDITRSVDTVAHRVCGVTTSFSYFAIGTATSTTPLVVNAPAQAVADASCHASVSLSATGPGTSTARWFLGETSIGEGGAITAVLPLGTNSVRVVAGSASETVIVQVVDQSPPQLSATMAPSTLWPPTGKLVSVTPTFTVSDNCTEHPSVALVEASSAEAVPADIVVTPFGLQLRAHRDGSSLAGRTYNVRYVATDGAGNRATATATVLVPHDQR